MALGGITVTWDVATPSGTSLAGTGQNDIRSLKTTLNQVLDSEHVFGATGGTNTGIHRKGSAVVHYGASSAISSTDTNGRLMIDSTNSRLHQVGSTNTMVLGGQNVMFGYYAGPAGVLGSKVTQMQGMEVSHGTILNGSTSTVLTLQNTWVEASVFVQPRVPSAGNQAFGGFPLTVGFISGTNQVTVYNASSYTAAGYATASSSTTYAIMVFVVGVKAL